MMKRIISLTAAVFVLGGAGFGAYVWHWEHRPHVLEIYCFALDKSGDTAGSLAIFIRTPDGHTALIDGGKSASVISALTSVMPFYRRSIDTLISTNPDDSHVTGLVSVIGRYHVGQIIEFNSSISDFIATSSTHAAFEDAISNANIVHHEVSAGDTIDFGDPDISASVLFPADFPFSKTNAPVMAFSIRYGSTVILFGGDLTKKEQAYVGGEISSSSVFSNSSRILLILPHGENVGVADESFFTALNPQNIQNVVILKKPTAPHPPTKKSTKTKKPAKIPFSITDIAGLSITNLVTEGDTEFVSDGQSFTEQKIN